MGAGMGAELVWAMKGCGKSVRNRWEAVGEEGLKPRRGLRWGRRVSKAWTLGLVRERPCCGTGPSSALAGDPETLGLKNTQIFVPARGTLDISTVLQ